MPNDPLIVSSYFLGGLDFYRVVLVFNYFLRKYLTRCCCIKLNCCFNNVKIKQINKLICIFRTPRAHEFGGTYGQGVIVRKYGVGSIINIRVELTANHNGYFEFRLCPDYKTTTQECLDKNVLKLVKPQEDMEHRGIRYFPREGNRVYEMKYRLPKRSCEHCVLQWKYIAGERSFFKKITDIRL